MRGNRSSAVTVGNAARSFYPIYGECQCLTAKVSWYIPYEENLPFAVCFPSNVFSNVKLTINTDQIKIRAAYTPQSPLSFYPGEKTLSGG